LRNPDIRREKIYVSVCCSFRCYRQRQDGPRQGGLVPQLRPQRDWCHELARQDDLRGRDEHGQRGANPGVSGDNDGKKLSHCEFYCSSGPTDISGSDFVMVTYFLDGLERDLNL